MKYTVNPDEIYDSPLMDETADDFLERIRHRSISHYTIQYIFSGEWAEIKIFPQWKKRSQVPKKGNRTKDVQQRLNHRNAVHKLCRLLNHNFKPYKDMFCTFTFDDDHLVEDMATGFEMADRALRRIKYQYRKAGVPLKAVSKVEIKKAKDCFSRYIRTADGRQLYRPHLHIVLNGGVPFPLLESAWKYGSNKRIELLRYDREGFLKLAEYLCKDTQEGRRRWSSTTNLVKPPPAKNIYSHRAASKSRVSDVAVNANLRREYFEQLLPGYSFVQSGANINEASNGCYIHARMAKR
ncbi:MAG: hypothetical protein J6K80_04775 [Oscillospiraceae bacterium]|nr:hypothetical protein [Oscillospiraceae bacterium]